MIKGNVDVAFAIRVGIDVVQQIGQLASRRYSGSADGRRAIVSLSWVNQERMNVLDWQFPPLEIMFSSTVGTRAASINHWLRAVNWAILL
jgi:hypothetical protein